MASWEQGLGSGRRVLLLMSEKHVVMGTERCSVGLRLCWTEVLTESVGRHFALGVVGLPKV